MCSALFGRVKTPEIKKVDPAVQDVSNTNIGADDAASMESRRRAKRKQGYAATRLSDVAMPSGGKTTLG